jgi:8-oxo-dGTP diphosphatase
MGFHHGFSYLFSTVSRKPFGETTMPQVSDPSSTGADVPAYPHEALAVVLQVRSSLLQVLLWHRAEEPFARHWALPGGLLAADERLGTAVARQLAAKVDVRELAHLEQLETRSDPDRDPRGRRLATAYLGIVPADLKPAIPHDTAWHPVEALPRTAFDHGSIIDSGRARLRAKLSYTTIGYALAPETFTISELRGLYAAALGHDVSATNLQRVLLRRGALEPTQTRAGTSPAGGRPASVYRFQNRRLEITNEFAAFRPRRSS